MTSRQSKTGLIQRKQLQLLQRQSALRQQSLQLQPQTPWFRLKGWFDHSETIGLARLTSLIGFVVGVIGALDWSSVISVAEGAFTSKQLALVGSVMVAQGVSFELARRRNMVSGGP